MAEQVILNGAYPGDPSAESVYASFEKAKQNFAELYVSFLQGGEFTADGTLVYPYGSSQVITYSSYGTIETMETTYDGKDWTLTLVFTDDQLTEMQSTDGTTSWNRLLTYNADGTLASDGGWNLWVP